MIINNIFFIASAQKSLASEYCSGTFLAKICKNNVAFVIYILLSIPALIIETLIWLGAIFFIFYYIFESFFNSRIWIEYLDYTFSLDGLSMFFVWFS